MIDKSAPYNEIDSHIAAFETPLSTQPWTRETTRKGCGMNGSGAAGITKAIALKWLAHREISKPR